MSAGRVQHVLCAEFDIDEGSLLRHQYPGPTGVDEHLLAELMLPDGAHARSEDWTVFYLAHTAVASGQTLYAISLVRTKKDDRVRRGALVKALAICTTEPYIQIYKPLLLLALEDYFNDPSLAILSNLLESINSMDMSSFPALTRFERQILRNSERTDMFEERFPAHSKLFPNGSPHKRLSSNSNHSRASSLANGSTVTASNESSESSPLRPRDTHYFETSVSYNKVQIPIRIPVGVEREDIGDYSLINLIQIFSGSHAFPPPFHPHLHVAGAQTPPILLLLYAMWTGKRIVFLGSSVPAGQVSQLVLAACAMASGGGSGVVPGFSQRAFPYSNLINRDNHEAVPGYIAGVTNPRFEAFTSSWDVFCNIDTGKISISKDLRMPAPVASPISSMTEESLVSPASTASDEYDRLLQAASLGVGPPPGQKHDARDSLDLVFMDEILAAVAARASEQSIRARFADWALRFVRLASKFEEEKLGTATIGWPSSPFSTAHTRLGTGFVMTPETARELHLHKPIIDAWMSTQSYQLCKQAFKVELEESKLSAFDVRHQVMRLRMSRNLPMSEAELIFSVLAVNVTTGEQVVELLAHLPLHAGGLLPLSFGLFHPSSNVKEHALQLLDRIDQCPTGHKFLSSLNYFMRIAYHRLSTAPPDAS